jgi:hypothetical protein
MDCGITLEDTVHRVIYSFGVLFVLYYGTKFAMWSLPTLYSLHFGLRDYLSDWVKKFKRR